MSNFDQRRCARVSVRTPLRILTPSGPLEAVTTDLSRTGAAIHIQIPEIEALTSPCLADAALCVHRRLGRRFQVELNPELLGSLLTKSARVVRLGDRIDERGGVTLGCRFGAPLNDSEMVSLGVPLPPDRTAEEEWVPRADLPAPHFRQPTRHEVAEASAPEGAPDRESDPADAPAAPASASRPGAPAGAPGEPDDDPFAREALGGGAGVGWRASVNRAAMDAAPLTGRVDRVTTAGIVLRLWYDGAHMGEMFEATDVVTAILAFTKTYGQEPHVKLMNGATHVWTGPTVLTEMGLPPQPGGNLYLNLRFGRHLRRAEQRSLGLDRVAVGD